MTSLRSLISLIFLGFIAAACGDDPEPEPQLPAALRADLQAIIDQAVDTGVTPGVVLQIAGRDGSWSGAAGVSNVVSGAAMAPRDRFRAGSVMKTLVATAVLQEVEEGRLGLDDVLTDRLPAGMTARVAGADTITVAMLLGHRSGVPEWVTGAIEQLAIMDPSHVWTMDQVLAAIQDQPRPFEPGEGYAYSNTNYVLLGEILSGIEGRSWRQVVRERVIARAGMRDTTLPEPGDMVCPGCARGYQPLDTTLLDTTDVDPSMAGASGGHALITTAADLARLLRRLRAGELFEREETLATMFAFKPAPQEETRQVGYGFGVMQMDVGFEVIGNLGGTAGYQCFMLYVPATGRIVTGFINEMGGLAGVLVPVLTRLAQP